MDFVAFDSAAEFLDRAGPALRVLEAENNLVLGIAEQVRVAGQTAFFGAAIDDGAVIATAIRTPPKQVLLTRGPEEALRGLASLLVERAVGVPAVLGIEGEVELFAHEIARLTNATFRVASRQRGYEIRRLVPPSPVSGRLRAAEPADVELLATFTERFVLDADLGAISHDVALAEVRKRTEKALLFVWDDGGPVSMASLTRPTETGIAVNFVYTPDDRRGRGYAKACVAALTQRCFDEGRKACFLNADLANPISNQVYRSIGYVAVADWAMVEFTPPVPAPPTP